jgi:toxin ParE1/3/4
VIERVILAAERLALFPWLGKMVPESKSLNIRELICGSYGLIYRVKGESVELLAVIHASRERKPPEPPPQY